LGFSFFYPVPGWRDAYGWAKKFKAEVKLLVQSEVATHQESAPEQVDGYESSRSGTTKCLHFPNPW
jgi:hypothetical protein